MSKPSTTAPKALRFKVYNSADELVATCAHASDAATLVLRYGMFARVRVQTLGKVWWNGQCELPAEGQTHFVVQAIMARLSDMGMTPEKLAEVAA